MDENIESPEIPELIPPKRGRGRPPNSDRTPEQIEKSRQKKEAREKRAEAIVLERQRATLESRSSPAPEKAPEPSVAGPQENPSGAGEFEALVAIVDEVVRLGPTLKDAPRERIAACVRQAVGYGLDPSGVGGFARVIYRHGKVALILGYTGIARMAFESGELVHIDARPVFEKDTFALDYAQQILQHAPYAGDDGSGPIVGAYAVFGSRQGIRQMQFVSGAQIKAAADRLWTEGMSAEEACAKIATMALLAASPLALPALRHALDTERRATE